MTPEEFEAEYDFKRPKKETTEKKIVFTCQSGFQASEAAHQLLQSGYVNLAVHQGDACHQKRNTLLFFSLNILRKVKLS